MNDSPYYHQKRRPRTQRGVSLIEVLVVLVILVTGILTIIRLFPSGFFSIQSTGNAALGDSLGNAAIQAGTQDAQSLPDSILPDNLLTDDLASAMTNAAASSNYDPDDPNNFENARVVMNETVPVPSVVNKQAIYAVKYGPVIMPADPSASVAALPDNFTINSPYWTALAGDSTQVSVVGSNQLPQDVLVPGQERFLVDLTNKQIAVPSAAYTPDGTTSTTSGTPTVTVKNAVSYPQQIVVMITCANDNNTYTRYLNVPAATPRNAANPYAPFGSNNQTYLPDTSSTTGNYQGGWFDPSASTYADSTPGTSPPTGEQWVSVTLYRPYAGLLTGASAPFDNDPYEFKLLGGNIGPTSNPGVVSFNPLAATGSGAQARKAQISYVVYRWDILHEDHDVPALTGSGSTFVVRTAVPNLLRAGSANPDNSINPGIAGSSDSLVILDLDSGQIIAPGTDPTLLNDEDLNGTVTDPTQKTINVSYSLGRITFGSNAFQDNSSPTDGSGTAPAHRIRIFYTADLNWTVAVQKAPSYFHEYVTSPSGTATGTTPLAANQYALDSTANFVYFARCNADRTVEVDGSYTSSGKTQSFSDTVYVDPVLNAVGDSNVRINLEDRTKASQPIPANATSVSINAVRGLSARAMVAWKERNLWKVHSVDAVLNRTP